MSMFLSLVDDGDDRAVYSLCLFVKCLFPCALFFFILVFNLYTYGQGRLIDREK